MGIRLNISRVIFPSKYASDDDADDDDDDDDDADDDAAHDVEVSAVVLASP